METPLIFDCQENQDDLSDNYIHLQCIAGLHFNPLTEMRTRDISHRKEQNYEEN